MPYSDIQSRIIVNGLDRTLVDAAMMQIYDNYGARIIEYWLSADPTRNIEISYTAANAEVRISNSGAIYIDPLFFIDNAFIGTDGKAYVDTFTTGLAHELGHALSNNIDNWTFDDPDGDNLRFTESIFYSLLGVTQKSYTSYEADHRSLEIGRDYLMGKGADVVIVDLGIVIGNGGSPPLQVNTVNANYSSYSQSFLLIGAAGNNTYQGGSGDDIIYGEGIRSETDGQTDRLFGNDGNDWLYGGAGDDELYGGNGDDVLNVEYGIDLLRGGTGNDDLFSGEGGGTFYGGAGSDWFVVDGQEGVSLSGDDGNDKFELNSTSNGLVVISGGKGHDWVSGSTPTPVVFTATAGDGRDVIDIQDASSYLAVQISGVTVGDLEFIFEPQEIGIYQRNNLDGLATKWDIVGDLVIRYDGGSTLIENLRGDISYPEQGEEGSPQIWPGIDNANLMEFHVGLYLTVAGEPVYITDSRYNVDTPFDSSFDFHIGAINSTYRRALTDYTTDRPSLPEASSLSASATSCAVAFDYSEDNTSVDIGPYSRFWETGQADWNMSTETDALISELHLI